MKPTLMIGSMLVTFALISYIAGIVTEQVKQKLNKFILFIVSLGLLFDISGTVCMILGSSNSMFTMHGLMGYSALLAMLVDVILLWNLKNKKGINANVPKRLHLYSRFALIWWTIVYASGTIMAMHKM